MLTFAGDGTFQGSMAPVTVEPSSVPEPNPVALFMTGLVVVCFSRKRRYSGEKVGWPGERWV